MHRRHLQRAMAGAVAALGLIYACAASAADPFTPRPPQPPHVEVRPPQPAFSALAAGATYIGTINGVTVYVEPSTGCYLYREQGHWRDSACLALARNRLHHATQSSPGH